MSRLEGAFDALRSRGETGLVTYVTAGDPDIERSEEILVALAEAGASVLEVGVPFSDPVADGPAIQRASERALAGGATLPVVIDLVSRVRTRTPVPLVLFSYFNPILRMGTARFVDAAAGAGADGVLVVDMPVEESAGFREEASRAGLDVVFLVSPVTSVERIRSMAALGSGFIYAISRLGVTGVRESLSSCVQQVVGRIRKESSLPVAVGFGISHPAHVAEVGLWAEAAVVGSSLVRVIEKNAESPTLVEAARAHVAWLLGRTPPGGSG